jgi:tRNA 2-thiocytidine biosynthesis protein TtcA
MTDPSATFHAATAGRRPNGTYRALNRAVGRAIARYDLIRHGDRILVGLSGGMDSQTLLWSLDERRARAPVRYELHPVFIDPGFPGSFAPELREHCLRLGYDLQVEATDYGVRGHSAENRENPCFLCARLRRKRLFEIAAARGCNRLALGHNKDDLIETLFLNMCYAAEISTMRPVQPLFGGALTIIRPLALADEDLIRRFARQRGFPVFENPCPSAAISKRREIKNLLQALYRGNRKIKGNIFRSLHCVKPDYLLKPGP